MATIGAFQEGVARHADTTDIRQNEDGVVTECVERWIVVAADGSELVPSNVTGLPKKGSAHSIHGGLIVDGYSWRHAGAGSRVWECNVSYKTAHGDSASFDDDEARVTLVEWGTASGSGDIVADALTGRAVKNSAGDPFDSVPTRDEVYPCVRFGKKERKFNPKFYYLNNRINESPLTVLGVIFAPHTCRFRAECRRDLDAEEFPYEWTFTFEGRDCWVQTSQLIDIAGGPPATVYETNGDKSNIGWDLAILECGFNYILNGEKVKFTILDDHGNVTEPSLPQLLDTSGAPLSQTADGILRVVRAYQEADLSGIAPEDA